MCSGEVVQVLEGHNSDVIGCDFFGPYLATCSGDKTIKVWQKNEEGRFEETSFSPLLQHTYGVNCVRFSPFGTLLASCSTDGKVILWNAQTGEKISDVQHSSGSCIRVCSFSPTSSILATGSDDENVILWDVATKSVIRVLKEHEAMITALAFTPDSAFLMSCSTAGDIMLWDARYGHAKCLLSLSDAHDLGVLGCDFSPLYEALSENGHLSGNYSVATCGNDDLIKIWLVKTGSRKTISLTNKLEGHSGNVMSCRFSPDGSVLASTAGDRLVILWNPKTGEALHKLEGHNRYVTCCAFSGNMLLATGSNDKLIIIWSLSKEKSANSALEICKIGDSSNTISQQRDQNFMTWTVDEVLSWLDSVKLSDVSDLFRNHSIDGKELMYLNHESLLTSMKIDSLGQRSKILRAIQTLKNPLWQHVEVETDNFILDEFLCPITCEVMRDPVVAADGYCYERCAIQEWLDNGNATSPLTNEVLAHKILIPNNILLQLIKKF